MPDVFETFHALQLNGQRRPHPVTLRMWLLATVLYGLFAAII